MVGDGAIALADIISIINVNDCLGSLVFLHSHDQVALERFTETIYLNTQIINVTKDSQDVLFALCCEATMFWDLMSAISKDVTVEHLVECIIGLTAQLNKVLGSHSLCSSVASKPTGLSKTAWSGGRIFAYDVDIDKFLGGSRREQQEDTLKRMADAAAALRFEHGSLKDRMVPTQGLFWLSELADYNDRAEWVTDTRFFREIYPSLSVSLDRDTIRCRAGDLETLLALILDDMTEIPGGDYIIGAEYEKVASEPPAGMLNISIPSFKIMRKPFLDQYFRMAVGQKGGGDARPATNVSYFDCREIADALTRTARAQGLLTKFNVPSEYQWEVAARGIGGSVYPWGDRFESDRCNCEMAIGAPSVCGMFSPRGDSEFGCVDMAGNVREWTRSYAGTRGVDWQYHAQSRVHADVAIDASSRIVLKGGSYSYDRRCVQSWVRNTQIASRRDGQTGFRLIAELV